MRVSAAGWLFLTWTIGGVLAFAAAGAIRLLLSDAAQWMLLGLSIPVGVFIVYWSLRAGRLQGRSPAPRQRMLFVSTGVPTYALFTAAILYAALYAIHTVVAKPAYSRCRLRIRQKVTRFRAVRLRARLNASASIAKGCR